ncbi:LPS-assembly protein LptD [Labrys miyagiensis]|uniref:LPS-assembly protein LptD n=1 Tax=Labrys miyagiensis TaxID=346912 RepID=A0ABQ6D0J0_9HYPH|nr:LPS-assembly protein LptD [Labrys miyagiensis]GLS24072.1 LPS-assembly protein LptD [Labrys miyagiensis]
MRVSARHFLTNVLCTTVAVAALSFALASSPARAQNLLSGISPTTEDNNGQKPNMVLKAKEMQYDQDKDVVTAVGSVQIYYNGRALQADRVVYDRKSKRVHAYGNVVITEADGTITHADDFDLTDDFKDGFVNSLRVLTTDETRIAANRAERTDGNVTVFQNGVYTACEPCKDNPARPPLWQVKAMKVIHNEQEKMLYFEDAYFEVYGLPIAYLPYMSSPDPTVTRKTGFVSPRYFHTSDLGYGFEAPYFIDLAPNYDLTLTPGFTTSQGPTGQIEWRHRLLNGSYSILASGAFLANPDKFANEDIGTPNFRGSVSSKGEFWLNDKWRFGWDVNALSDKFYWRDYKFDNLRGQVTATSTLYLTGSGDKSWFDLRGYYFQGLTSVDVQKQLPTVLPVLDYDYVVNHPVLGGEVGWNFNFTNLTRQQSAYDNIVGQICNATTPITRSNCLLRGIDGNYARGSLNLYWKKTITDSWGEQWTPFTYVRGDLGFTRLDDPNNQQFVGNSNDTAARVLPAIGLDYRYPFISQSDWGTQIFEPIAQVILRPKAAQTGSFPNEDAQSLIFDDSNLFAWDKYSGYDRVEDGSRINAGFQYSLTTNGGGYYNALFGQSYSFGGTNPYKDPDMANTGLQSGLDTNTSDYVGRIYLQPVNNFAILTDARFNEKTWNMKAFEVGAIGTIGNLKTDITYASYEAQPLLGLEKREGVNGTAAWKVAENWVASAGAQYDMRTKRFSTSFVGLTYVDACIAFGMSLQRDYDTTSFKYDTTVQVQLQLRGLGVSGNPKEFADKVWNDGFNNANVTKPSVFTDTDGNLTGGSTAAN